ADDPTGRARRTPLDPPQRRPLGGRVGHRRGDAGGPPARTGGGGRQRHRARLRPGGAGPGGRRAGAVRPPRRGGAGDRPRPVAAEAGVPGLPGTRPPDDRAAGRGGAGAPLAGRHAGQLRDPAGRPAGVL
ncbi:MAG: hypothetical protein AVDCRST_MAG66-20, partial [uncultured Pseudonocardia sp.]